MNDIHVHERAGELPDEWDQLAGSNLHLRRSYLRHAESALPCSQRYVIFRDASGRIDGVLVHHQQAVDLFTLSGLPISWMTPLTCIGPPASVSDPGIAFRASARERIEEYLASLPGLSVILNLEPTIAPFRDWIALPHLPGFRLTIRWRTFDEFLSGMRCSYRRRCHLALRRSSNLTSRFLADNATEFTDTMHGLYKQVHARAAHKLEKLPRAYFAGEFGRIAVFEEDSGRPVGFTQTYKDGDRLTFGFGGVDYTTQPRHDTYLRMLLGIIREAVETDCRVVNLGQTAAEAKTRLGAVPIPMNLMIRHSHRLVQAVFRRFGYLLSETTTARAHRVFRNAGDDEQVFS